jgi:hypothetical protein
MSAGKSSMIPGRTGSENPHGKACIFASVSNNDEAQLGIDLGYRKMAAVRTNLP